MLKWSKLLTNLYLLANKCEKNYSGHKSKTKPIIERIKKRVTWGVAQTFKIKNRPSHHEHEILFEIILVNRILIRV